MMGSGLGQKMGDANGVNLSDLVISALAGFSFTLPRLVPLTSVLLVTLFVIAVSHIVKVISGSSIPP